MDAPLTEEQLKRVEENRLKALKLREAKKQIISNETNTRAPNVQSISTICSSGGKESNAAFTGGFSASANQLPPPLLYDKVEEDLENNRKRILDRNDSHKCSHCSKKGAYLDQTLFEIFEENVCVDCLKKMKANEGASPFDLITKTEGVKTFMLPVDTIDAYALPYKSQHNPRHPGFNIMKLYLRKHLHEAAIRRYGSEEEFEKERSRRSQMQYEREAKRTEDALKSTSMGELLVYEPITKGRSKKDSNSSRSSSSNGEESEVKVKKTRVKSGTHKRKLELMSMVACIRGDEES